jgi:ATP-dependent DNA helicase DinG
VSTGPSLPARTLDVFNDVLTSAWKGYAPRAGQLSMTGAVAKTIEQGGISAHESPCGVGKSLAYLVPAILHADREGRTVIVVTASIALQEQLVGKDLPALATALAPVLSAPLTFALLKGRGNYLCQNTLNEPAPAYLSADEADELDAIDAWGRTTQTGDRGDLPLIVRDGVWRLRTVGPTNDIGKRNFSVGLLPGGSPVPSVVAGGGGSGGGSSMDFPYNNNEVHGGNNLLPDLGNGTKGDFADR